MRTAISLSVPGPGLKLGRSAARNTNTLPCSPPIRRPASSTAGPIHGGFYSYHHLRYSGFHTKATQAQVEPEPETKVVGTHGRAAETTATGAEGTETGRGGGNGKGEGERKKGRRTYSVADILERRARAGRMVAGTAAYIVCLPPFFSVLLSSFFSIVPLFIPFFLFRFFFSPCFSVSDNFWLR